MRPFGSLVLWLLLLPACSSAVIERFDPTPDGADPGSGSVEGADDDTRLVPPPRPAPDDSGTLTVDVSVTAWGDDETSEDEVSVEFIVTIEEWLSGAPVNDAEVTGGPLGANAPLVYDVYSLSSYGLGVTGYHRTWELSIRRGDDYLTGVVLVGPSFQSLSVAPTPDEATITWSPSNEEGVTSVGCAYTEAPLPFTGTCSEGNDEGTLTLASSERGALPSEGPYQVTLVRRTKVPVGLGGAGSVFVSTRTKVDP